MAFGIGLAIMLTGLALRGWAIRTLGDYFTGAVALAGLGLASANWIGFAAMAVISLTGVLWRIHTEERALLATLGTPYRAYAAQHKRLVPLVW